MGNGRMRRSSDVVSEQRIMRLLLVLEVHKHIRAGHGPLWPDDEVSIEVVRDVARGECTITFSSLGPRPKGRTGRDRDTQNLLDSVCDAAQGIVYANDNQIADARVRRVIGG